jgi:hypothetical protein
MSEHETDLLEQTTRKLAWIARGMVALIGIGFAAGVWMATQQAEIARLGTAAEASEKRHDKVEHRLEAYQVLTSQKFETLLASQSAVLVSVAEMRAEMRALTERIDRAHKNGQ